MSVEQDLAKFEETEGWESIQMQFSGTGWVLVQPSEGPYVPMATG
ncbi:MAG: hypothetical protein ACR2OC_12585 [Solirubrobacterales bacterium]